MAKTWKEVVADPQYQALPPEQKSQAQAQYFMQVIAPQAGNDVQQAAAQFYAQYPPADSEASQGALQQAQPQQVAGSQPMAGSPATAQQAQPQQQIPAAGVAPSQDPSVVSQIAQGGMEAGRAALQAGVNTFNIIPEVGDAVTSAAAWLGKKLGIGDGTYTPAMRASLPQSLQPQTEAGKVAAEVLPYLANPASGAERAALQVADTAAGRLAARAGGSVAENAVGSLAQNSGANSGTDQGASGLAGDLAINAGISGGVRAAGAGIKAGYRTAREMLQGGSGNASGVTDALRSGDGAAAQATQPAQDVPAQAIPDYATPQQAVDAVSPARAAADGTEQALKDVVNDSGQAAKSGERGVRSFAQQINPDSQIIESAQRLGVDDSLTPGMYSQNPAYRAFENAMGSIPTRETYHAQRAAIARLGQAADTFISDFGGTVDKSFANQRVADSYGNLIGGIKQQENNLYQTVRDAIPTRATVNPDNTIREILSFADDIGGPDNLPAAYKSVLKRLDNPAPDNQPTYGLLDYVRKEIGQAGAGRGIFKDEQTARLDRLYAALSLDQGQVAKQYGVGDAWNAAKEMSVQRFAVQDAAKASLGKDLNGDVISKLQKSVVDMAQGSGNNFKTIVNNLPPDIRQEAVVTALNKAFTSFAKSPGQQLGVPGFYKWYVGMNRNKSNMQALSRVLGYDATKRLNDLATVAKGMQRLGSEKIYSASQIDRILTDFDKGGGLISKMYGVGKNIAKAEGFSSAIGLPGAGTTGVLIDALRAPKTGAVEAADKMLASPSFRQMTRSNVTPAARAAAERQVMKSAPFRQWYDSLPPNQARAVTQQGLLKWLTATDGGANQAAAQ